MITCPCCKGEGGYTEVVLDDGSGPYYPCDYCQDKCNINIFKWLSWMLSCEWKWSSMLIDRYYEWKDTWNQRNQKL